MGGSQAEAVGVRECVIVDAGVCGTIEGVQWEWWDMLGSCAGNAGKRVK